MHSEFKFIFYQMDISKTVYLFYTYKNRILNYDEGMVM